MNYPVLTTPTTDKIESYNRNKNTFYRIQNTTHEIGNQSWGMIYSTPQEAIEDGEEVLDGKSAFTKAKSLYNYTGTFDEEESQVIIIKGYNVGTGPDDEDLVDVEEILETWSLSDFYSLLEEMMQDEDFAEEWWF